MYLHIGNGESVRDEDIIGIFDLDTSTVSQITKNFIGYYQKKELVEYKDSDIPRAFVLVGKNKEYKVRLSRISTSGLRIRAEEADYTE